MLLAWLILLNTVSYSQINNDSLSYYQNKSHSFKDLPIDSISYFCEKGIEFSDVYHKIWFLRIEANYLKKYGKMDKAFGKLQQALELLKYTDSMVLEGELYFDISNYYYHFNQFKESYEYILKSKEIIIGVSQEEIDKFNKIYNQNFTLDELLQPILFNIAVVALDNGELEVTEKHLHESLKYCQDVGNKQGVIDAKINLANLWAQKKEYRKGIKAYLKLLEENELSESDSSLVYYNLATNSFELKKYKDSERYINVAISLSERLKDCVQLIDLYLIKAQVLMELDRYEEALVFLKKSLHESLQINDVENTVVLYKNLAKCESLLKHENKSINWYEKMIQLSDSIQESKQENYSLFKQISLENKVLSQKTENKKHLETISIQKKHKRLLITTIVLVVLLLVALSYLFVVNKKNNFKRLELIKQKIQTEEAQLENARILKDIETRQIQEDLKVKKRELILLLLHSKKRKSKLNQIIKEFDRLIGKSIVKNSDLEQLKEFVIQQSNELDVNLDIQNRLLNSQDDFFVQLLKDYPNLSKTEIKVLAFMRVGLSTKEIAETQYVSLDAVRKTRYRIRKKLCLEKNESLEKFVLQY